MEKIDIGICIVIAALMFCFGLGLGDGFGYQKGYKEGFEKALPLTYASVYKK